MKILWVSEFPPDKGAVSDYSLHLLKEIAAKSGHEIDILSVSGEEPEEIDEESLNVIGKIPEKSSEWGQYFDGKYDLAHFQYHLPHLRQFLKYKMKGGRTPELMVTLHDVPSEFKHKVMFLFFRKVILLTDETEEKFRSNYPLLIRMLRHDIYQTPYLGIDKQLPERVSSKEIDTELDQEKINIVCPGFVHRKKGFDKVVEILPEVQDELGGDVFLTIAGGQHREGSSEYIEGIKERVKELGVEDSFRITGLLPTEDHVNAYIQEADVVALPFNEISQSATLTKTLAQGTTPVVTPVDTLEPAIEKYGGIMMRKDDQESLKESIFSAVKEEHQIDERQIREDLSWEKNADRYLEIYEEIED